MKIFLDTIGCRLNQSEIEIMASQFRQAGHAIIPSPAEADLIVINTCAVTGAAASDSRQKIRQAAKYGNKRIIATGCWATLEPQAALELPGVENVVLNENKSDLVSDLLQISPQIFDIEPLAREVLPGTHQRTRAFIKVQDGCDNFCTFCITKIARGKGVSEPLSKIMNAVNQALQGGAQEIVLSGVHLGSWGKDLDEKLHLANLIQAILSDSDVKRLRLSSLEPWDLDESFFELWNDPRLCNHLHLPLQSGSDAVLRRMARKTSRETYREIVSNARAVEPEMAVTTDMIVGFPGENDDDFAETLEFVREIGFAGGHVFPFSARPGTAAAKYAMQIPGPIRKRRSAVLRALFLELALLYQQPFIGRTVQVLWESSERQEDGSYLLKGLTDNYLKVSAGAQEIHWNVMEKVQLTHFYQDSIFGVLL
jgi:threonylcarbamoyladenosine tRNA methylthiotransferase MtaB